MQGCYSGARKRFSTTISVLSLLAVLLMACSSGDKTTANPTPTPTNVQYVDYDLHIPPDGLNSPTIGPLPPDTKLHVIITFKANQDELKKLKALKDKADSGVDLKQEANKIGITDEQYAKIKQYLGVDGVSLSLDTLHTNLTVDAKASLLERLLQTRFVQHKLKNGRVFYAPETAPKIPDFMKDRIVGINGLDNYSQAPTGHAGLQKASPLTSASKQTAHADNCFLDNQTLDNQQVAHAYGYDSFWKEGFSGKGMTVNLVELESFDQSDAQGYFDCVGYKGNFNVVNVGQEPPAGKGIGESTLDIDMVAGLAPYANINVYQGVDEQGVGSWNVFNDILAKIANDNANSKKSSVVSISWGGAEADMTPEVYNAMSTNLQLLTDAEHMTVFIASMDCGAFSNREWNQLGVSYPASDPYATAVGGTQLSVDGQGNRSSEVVWQDGSDKSKCENQWGSGGGLSSAFDQPQYADATGLKNSYSNGHRQVPDIAAAAKNLAVFYKGEWYNFAGTSAATPIWAAGMALLNQKLIVKHKMYVFSTDLFYEVAHANQSKGHPFYDITKGDNLYYPATKGWDYATGLGAPNLTDFYATVEGLL
ncbi:pseudomonapepsin [Ktedonobacter sp. SOSP1-85]|uniref:S53 family peptidase n=1 Tax=Ktedonobacter sp. SOSP1-85 TaxID=2778367 RepID=UPI00191521A2|nr:S53 family peptidase [Ktedonobacter sp. SOSP1-85]GHO78733.1 pseudomonapepsin [Ktedonobacter sp. SOSP1-85]